jgi:hypothetical protein
MNLMLKTSKEYLMTQGQQNYKLFPKFMMWCYVKNLSSEAISESLS